MSSLGILTWWTWVTPQVFIRRKWKTVIHKVDCFEWRTLVDMLLTFWTLYTITTISTWVTFWTLYTILTVSTWVTFWTLCTIPTVSTWVAQRCPVGRSCKAQCKSQLSAWRGGRHEPQQQSYLCVKGITSVHCYGNMLYTE